jgi:hypothetical protein
MTWVSSGRLASTTANQVLVTTGVIGVGTRNPLFQASSSVAVPLEIQHIAADGTTVIDQQVFAVPAFDFQEAYFAVPLEMAVGESLRIIAITAVTGNVSASIHYQP